MLTLQQFQQDGYLFSLKKVSDQVCIIAIQEIKTGEEQRLEMPAKNARHLIRILTSNQFIFSESNK